MFAIDNGMPFYLSKMIALSMASGFFLIQFVLYEYVLIFHAAKHLKFNLIST